MGATKMKSPTVPLISHFFRRWVLWIIIPGCVVVFGWAHAPHARLPEGTRADRLVVEKQKRLLHLYRGHERLKSYPVSLGWKPVGPKEKEGDYKTPEGKYRITEHKEDSSCHRALRVSYPDASDMARAKQQGVEPGGNIMIHGLRNGFGWLGRSHRWMDWTAGCVAVTNPEMDEIFEVVDNGAAIEIMP